MASRAVLLLAPLLGLAGCVGGGADVPIAAGPGVECAPYARRLSGIQLYGDAGDWWAQAAGRYQRVSVPAPGSVLVFRRTGRLPSGHVSTVARVVSSRTIEVDDAKWVHGAVTHNEPVIDVSDANAWTLVRVWWAPTRQLGARTYPTYGFIRAGGSTPTAPTAAPLAPARAPPSVGQPPSAVPMVQADPAGVVLGGFY